MGRDKHNDKRTTRASDLSGGNGLSGGSSTARVLPHGEPTTQRPLPESDHKQGTILVVDDEPGVLMTIQAILRQEGYQVDGASTGTSALDKLRTQTYELVLTDLRLGDMDGLEVLAAIRQVSPRTLAIVLTGYASLESAIQAMREGAYDYLVKPTDVEELKLRVAHCFERHRLADEVTSRMRDLEEANATIASMNAHLHQEVIDATAELQARLDELAAAKTALEHSQAQKERFTAMVAHELRGPLAPIKFGAQALQRHPERVETVLSYAEKIVQQSDRLERLITDLLDVTRIDSGRFSILRAPFDLTEMVTTKVEEYRQRHADRVFVVHTPVEPLIVSLDRLRLEQACMNLLDNAVKYSLADTSITITLALVPDEDATSDWVTLSVADEGRGIPKDKLDVIFDPFRRLEGTEDIQGYGLGLYITRGIAEAHQGKLTVESGSDRAHGAIFTLWLPHAS